MIQYLARFLKNLKNRRWGIIDKHFKPVYF
jgi:hypothetical protein